LASRGIDGFNPLDPDERWWDSIEGVMDMDAVWSSPVKEIVRPWDTIKTVEVPSANETVLISPLQRRTVVEKETSERERKFWVDEFDQVVPVAEINLVCGQRVLPVIIRGREAIYKWVSKSVKASTFKQYEPVIQKFILFTAENELQSPLLTELSREDKVAVVQAFIESLDERGEGVAKVTAALALMFAQHAQPADFLYDEAIKKAKAGRKAAHVQECKEKGVASVRQAEPSNRTIITSIWSAVDSNADIVWGSVVIDKWEYKLMVALAETLCYHWGWRVGHVAKTSVVDPLEDHELRDCDVIFMTSSRHRYSLFEFWDNGLGMEDLYKIMFCLHSTKTSTHMKLFSLVVSDPGERWIMQRVVDFAWAKVTHLFAPYAELGGPFFICGAMGGSSGKKLYTRRLSDDMVSAAVKWAALKLGLNGYAFSSHSNRRATVTQLRTQTQSRGKEEVMAVSGHKSESSFDLYDFAVVERGACSGTEREYDEDVVAEVSRLRQDFGRLRMKHISHQDEKIGK
jgi:hypothetical protein